MPKTFQGVAKGNIIELTVDSGLPSGQPVTITLQSLNASPTRNPGDGIQSTAGSWASDGEEADHYLETARDLRRAGN